MIDLFGKSHSRTVASFRPVLPVLCFCLASGFLVGQSRSDSRNKQRIEEAENYYRKWLEEDVVFIITPDEKAVFKRLTTTEEKDNFIEQFWLRRDDDASTVDNPFKQEHYRRIAYANEHFASGYPGWLTDRGRIYITFGAPDEIEYHSSGETYNRPLNEGGGVTSTFPYQVWRYRHVEGVGTNIILEFVDRTLSGEFRLAVHPDEKDALWNTDAGGPTLLEQLEMAKKRDRGTLQQQLGFERERDSAFLRYETYAKVLSPPKIRYKDLQQVVDTNIRYADLPFVTRDDYIRLNENQVLVLVSLQVNNKELNFEDENGVRTARLAVYGIVTSIAKRVIYEFDDDLQIRFDGGSVDAALQQSSVYQKIIPLDQGRYKISLVVKDLNGERIGVVEQAIKLPAYQADTLASSSLILSESIRTVPPSDEMFVLGDLKVRPNLTREFLSRDPLGIYFQIYNAELDQTTGVADLEVEYRILREGEVLFELLDSEGESIQFQSGARVVLVKGLSLERLEAGRYRVQVRTRDRISGEDLLAEEDFKVVESP